MNATNEPLLMNVREEVIEKETYNWNPRGDKSLHAKRNGFSFILF